MSSEPDAQQPDEADAGADVEESVARSGSGRVREIACASPAYWCGSPGAIRTTFPSG